VKDYYNRDGPTPIENLRDDLDFPRFLDIFNFYLASTLGGSHNKGNEDYWFDDI